MKIFFKLILVQEERRVKGDDVTIEDLMPTLKYDVQIVTRLKENLKISRMYQPKFCCLTGVKVRSIHYLKIH